MKLVSFFLILLVILFSACNSARQESRNEIKRLRANEASDSSFVYTLPFERGKAYRVIQGYFGRFSHKNRAAIDFNMRSGDTVVAARGGVVSRVKQDGKRGGLRKKYRVQGNNIVILHNDSSRAGYWHLKENSAFVKQGDTVRAGQAIALSGKTGYAASPHLHFIVWRRTTDGWQQRPTLFRTSSGNRYLKAWKKYRR